MLKGGDWMAANLEQLVKLDQSALSDLGTRLRGALLLPGDPPYDEARSIWNGMIDRRPALIVRCLGVSDVLACVNFAHQHGLQLSIKGGGHNISGLAVCDGGMLLDMSLMRGVWVDPRGHTARAQPGCLLSDVDRETQVYGLAAVLGFVSTTGIAGLTLGGGFGYLSRRFGWTSDNVRSMDVVTADGRLVRASQDENPDLFWGLCGGGGNFGVVTSIEYALHPVGPEIVAGGIAWDIKEAEGVLEMYREIIRDAPPEMVCVSALRIAPPAPWLAKDIHGKPIIGLFVCHTGPVKEGERAVAAIKSFRSPVGDVIQRRSYLSQQSLLDATQPKGRRYYWKSDYLPGFPEEMVSKLIEHAQTIASPHSGIIYFPLDGALNQLPEDHSAAGNRDAAAVLNITASWERPEDDNVNIEWARQTWRDMHRFSTGGTYINFQTLDEGDDRIRAAYGDNYAQLVEVKRKWDSENFFRTNKNIVP